MLFKRKIIVFSFLLLSTTGMAQMPAILPVLTRFEHKSKETPATTPKPTVAAKSAAKTPKPKQRAAKYVVPVNDSLSMVARYAQFMQVADTCIKAPELYTAIDEWIGTPYRYGRNKIKEGTDCSGFVGKVFELLFNAKLPRSAAGVAGVIEAKPKTELKEGDLIIFNYYGRRNSHVGIYLQNGWFVHASNVYGVTLANLNTGYYQQKFSKGGSVKGLAINNMKGDTLRVLRVKVEELKKLPTLMPQLSNK